MLVWFVSVEDVARSWTPRIIAVGKHLKVWESRMKYFVMVALLMFSVSASAGFCEDLSELAESAMIKRQEGARMERLYNHVEGNDLAQRIVRDAYNTPFYQTAKYKNQAVNEFANKWFRLCLKATE